MSPLAKYYHFTLREIHNHESSNDRPLSAWYHTRPSYGAAGRPRVDVESQGQAPQRGALRAALSQGHPPIATLGRPPHQSRVPPLLLALRPGPAAQGGAPPPQGPGLLHLLARRAPQADWARRQGDPPREPDRVLPAQPYDGLHRRRLRLRLPRHGAQVPRSHGRALPGRVSEGDPVDGVHAGGQPLPVVPPRRYHEVGADQARRARAALETGGHLRDHAHGEDAEGRRHALPRLPPRPRHHLLGLHARQGAGEEAAAGQLVRDVPEERRPGAPAGARPVSGTRTSPRNAWRTPWER